MKGEILFEKMTNISDEYIAEAELIPMAGRPRRQSPDNALTRFFGSGWGVAMLCAVVSLIAVVAMVQWGRMPPPTPPVGTMGEDTTRAEEITPEETEQHTEESAAFSFGFELSEPTVRPGATIQIDTWVKNEGNAFSLKGSSGGFAPHAVLRHEEGGTVYTIEGDFPMTDDYTIRTVNTGDIGWANYTFTIPEDAPRGSYILALSYGKAIRYFDHVLTVEDETPPETQPEEVILQPTEEQVWNASGITPLSDALKDEIIQSYMAEKSLDCPENHISLRYYGAYGDSKITCHVLFVDVAGAVYYKTLTQENLDGLIFEYPTTQTLLVYHQGHFMTLKESIDCGYLKYHQMVGPYQTYYGLSEDDIYFPPDAQPPEEETGIQLSYECLNTPTEYVHWRAGDTLQIRVSVTKDGQPVQQTSSSQHTIPHAELHLKAGTGLQTLRVIQGTYTVSEEQAGTVVYEFTLPEDAPTGPLELQLSYGDTSLSEILPHRLSDFPIPVSQAIALAEGAARQHYPDAPFDHLAPRVSDSTFHDGQYTVSLYFDFYGYRVTHRNYIHVTISPEGQATDVKLYLERDWDFLLSAKEQFLAAKDEILAQIMEFDRSIKSEADLDSPLTLTLDVNPVFNSQGWRNYLTIRTEYIGPPIYDRHGNTVADCGDHNHYFFQSRLYVIEEEIFDQ